MSNSDKIQRFLFNNADIRGEHVVLDRAIAKILDLYPYPPAIAELLAQALCAVALISAMLKFKGKISLQLQHGRQLPLLFAEADDNGNIRGLAQWKQQADLSSFSKTVQDGVLTVNLMPENGQQYQGVIALESDNLATCLEQYFLQSEQLHTKFWLFNHQYKSAGLMLQQLPSEQNNDTEIIDTWDELTILTETIKPQEIIDTPCDQLLTLLYSEYDIQLFEATEINFRCQCSEQRALTSILMVAKKELTELFKQQDTIESNCEFCLAHYQFSKQQIFQALLESKQQNPKDKLH